MLVLGASRPRLSLGALAMHISKEDTRSEICRSLVE